MQPPGIHRTGADRQPATHDIDGDEDPNDDLH